MARKPGINGVDNMMRGLNGKLTEYQISGTRGLRGAAGFIRREMEMTPPKVPVDTGNLRASWFIEAFKTRKNKSVVKFGFNANYAVYVHEMVDADFSSPRMRGARTHGGRSKKKGMYTPREGAGAKFLESAIKRNVFKILLIIRNKMTIGGTKT